MSEDLKSEPTKRKKSLPKKGKLMVIADDLEFTKNKCSDRARIVKTVQPNLVFEVWFDQHYHIRKQFGDDDGERLGINPEYVESLVLRSTKHLVAYSVILKTFSFVNHGLNGGRATRIILKEQIDEGLLNVAIETHLKDIDCYEITVKTAMCEESFSMSDGQFAIQLFDNESELSQMSRGRVNKVSNL